MISLRDSIQRLQDLGRRRFPSIFGRVSQRDVREAEAHLNQLTDEELAAGREAARRAIETARARDKHSS